MVTLAGHKDAVVALKWCTWNNNQVVSASWDHSVALWDLQLGCAFCRCFCYYLIRFFFISFIAEISMFEILPYSGVLMDPELVSISEVARNTRVFQEIDTLFSVR